MDSITRKTTLTRLAVFLLVGWWLLTAYTFLHESGHALAAVAFGGRLISFDIDFWDFTAHSASTGNFTAFQHSILAIAGMALPYIVWSISLLLIPPRRPLLADVLVMLASLGMISTLLPWVVLSILYANGISEVGDDITYFLMYSGWNGYAAAAAFTLLMFFSGVFFWKKSGGLAILWRALLLDHRDDSQWANQAVALVLLLSWLVLIWTGEKY
jgi:hypothetical protein